MTILILIGLYSYSTFKMPSVPEHMVYEGQSEIRLAWHMRSLFFYESWLIGMQKKGHLMNLNECCRRTRLDGVMSSSKCAIALLIVYTTVLAAGLEVAMVLFSGSWNIFISMGSLLIGAAMGVRFVEEFFLKIKRVRYRQISQQLPVFLTKLMLNLGAGVNVRDAWEKSLEDKEKGYFYKHGWQVLKDLELSGSLRIALEQMCLQMSDYRVERLVKLLVQMRDYGDSGFMGKLESMKLELWQERLRVAREMAEEAKVKLLLPLLMILGGTLLVIMIPILMAMKGVFL